MKFLKFIIIGTVITTQLGCSKESSFETGRQPDTVLNTPQKYQITFQKIYGGPNAEDVHGVHQTSDNGYIIIGTTSSFGAGDEDIYVIKTDSAGKTLWTKTYGGVLKDNGHFIRQTSDGGYILGGVSESFGSFSLIKIDANGNHQWAKVYDGRGVADVQQTRDGGYIVAGWANGLGGNIRLIKTDNIGNITWAKRYECSGYGSFVLQTSDGGFVVTGITTFGFGGYDDIFLLKTNSSGNFLWAKSYDGSDHPQSAMQTSDGGFVISGWTTKLGAGVNEAHLIKTDANGNLMWSKTYGSTGWARAFSIEQTAEQGYVISGATNDVWYGQGKAMLIKTDSSGNPTWSKTYGGVTESITHAHQTKDNGYIIVSSTNSFGAVNRDIYLIKTNSKGESGCHEGSFVPIVTSHVLPVTNLAASIYTGGTVNTASVGIGSGGTSITICEKK